MRSGLVNGRESIFCSIVALIKGKRTMKEISPKCLFRQTEGYENQRDVVQKLLWWLKVQPSFKHSVVL